MRPSPRVQPQAGNIERTESQYKNIYQNLESLQISDNSESQNKNLYQNFESLQISDNSEYQNEKLTQNFESLQINDDSEPDNLVYPKAPNRLKRAHIEHPYDRPERKGPVKPKRIKISRTTTPSEKFDAIQIDEQYKIDELDKVLINNPSTSNDATVMMFVNSDEDAPKSYSDIKNHSEPEKWY